MPSPSPLPAQFPVLACLKNESALSLASTFVRFKVPKGAAVFEEGSPPEAAFLLAEGLVKAVKYSSRESPSALEFFVPGRLFGMIAVLDSKPYPVTTLAVRDSVLYRIAGPAFNELMRRHPEFGREVYRQIGDHVRSSQALRIALEEPVPARLALILCALHDSVGSDLHVLREDVAAMAGTSVGTVVRELAKLRRRGFVETGWKRLRIRDVSGLRSLVPSK